MQLNNEHKKKNIALVIMILTLMVSVTGATYAFFEIAPAVNNSVYGVASTAKLDLNITRIIPTTEVWNTSSKVMAPQLESALNLAMNNYGCVDSYGNVICQVYEIVLLNESTARVEVDGKISFSGIFDDATNPTSIIMPNLKWKHYGSTSQLNSSDVIVNLSNVASNVIPDEVADAKEPVLIDENVILNPQNTSGDKKYYYMVIWINSAIDENGNELTQTDHGTYKVTVDFRGVDGTGITSTFTQ